MVSLGKLLREIHSDALKALNEVPVQSGVVDEVSLFTLNDSDIHRQRIQPILKNLKRKKAQGKFKKELAIKAFVHAANDGIKKYEKTLGDLGIARSSRGKTAKAVAAILFDHFSSELDEFFIKYNTVLGGLTEDNKTIFLNTLNDDEGYLKIVDFVEEN